MWYMRGNCDNKERDSNWTHPLLRVLGYKRESVILWRVTLRRLGCPWDSRYTSYALSSRILASTKLLPMGEFGQHKYLYQDTWWPTLLILNLLKGCNKKNALVRISHVFALWKLVAIIPTLICAIRLPPRTCYLFTLANYLGLFIFRAQPCSKRINIVFVTVVVNIESNGAT